ncbi:lipopolysaccharide biosynthesis protein [Natrialbaceae archaeon A-CW2]
MINKILSDSLVTGIRTIISTIRGLIVIPLITNLLGAGSYGIWTTVLAVIGLVKSTGNLHLHGALIRFGSRDELHEKTFSDILFLVIVVGAFVSVCVFFIGNMLNISSMVGDEVGDSILLLLASSLLIYSSMVWQIIWNFPRAKGNVKTYDIIATVKDIIESIGLALVFLTGYGITSGIIMLIVITMGFNALVLYMIDRNYTLVRPSASRYVQYLRYSVPLIPQIVSGKLLQSGDKYLILYFLTPAAVGIYSVAYSVSSMLVKFTSILNSTLYPTISNAWDEGHKKEISYTYGIIFRGYSILAIPALCGIILLSDSLIELISTEEIATEAIVLMPILTFAFIIKGAHNPLSFILTASERTEQIAIVTIAGTFSNLLLNIVLIPELGIFGAAVATAFSSTIIFVLIYYYASSKISLPIPYATIFRSGIATLLMGLVLYHLPIEESVVQLLIYPIVGSTIYFVILLASGEITRGEMKKALNASKRLLDW